MPLVFSKSVNFTFFVVGFARIAWDEELRFIAPLLVGRIWPQSYCTRIIPYLDLFTTFSISYINTL